VIIDVWEYAGLAPTGVSVLPNYFPLAYREEKEYATLGKRGEHEQTNRLSSRHA
jgi:hypothetical protein